MSTGRGRSWRPEKTHRARDSRRRQVRIVGGLLAVLVSVAGYLVWSWLRPVPPLHLVSVAAPGLVPQEGIFRGSFHAAAAHNVAEFARLAEQIHSRNSGLVGEPTLAAGPSELEQLLRTAANEKLFIYCCADAVAVPDDTPGSVVLDLLPGGPNTQPLRFAKLLSMLQGAAARQIVLVLEPGGREPGLASGVLTSDVVSLIEQEVKSAAIPSLTVICACGFGQRSWEYLDGNPARKPGTQPGAPPAEVSDQSAAARVYYGTAFGHFLRQALLTGETATADRLFQYLKTSTADWVREHHREVQTVTMFSTGKNAASAPLLSLARGLPGIDATGSQPAPAGAVAAPADGIAATGGTGAGSTAAGAGPGPEDAGTSGGTKKPGRPETPADRFLRQIALRDELATLAVAPAAAPVEWIDLQSLLLSFERCLLYGTDPEMAPLHDRIAEQLNLLTQRAARVAHSLHDDRIRQWICQPIPPSAEQLQKFPEYLAEAVPPAGTGRRLPRELQTAGQDQQAFAGWLMAELSQLAGAPREERLKRIGGYAAFLQVLRGSQSGWQSADMPHQLTALAEVLRDDDAAWQSDVLPPLTRLIQLRQKALQAGAGLLPGGQLIRRQQWASVSGRLDQSLTRLTAAEGWLSLGRPGLQPAVDRLSEAELLLGDVEKSLRNSGPMIAVADARLTELPFLLQYLADQQEQNALLQEELRSVARMARAAVSGEDPESAFPHGQMSAIGLTQEHVAAMFALTRAPSESNISRPADYALLQQYARDRRSTASRLSMYERRALLSLPRDADRQTFLRQLPEPPTGSQPDRTRERTQSGVWRGFWSVRLLDALSEGSVSTQSLWQQWQLLVESLLAETDAGEQTGLKSIAIRSRLATDLQAAWRQFLDQRRQATENAAFVDRTEVTRLIVDDLRRRYSPSSTEVTRLTYFPLLRDLSGSPPDEPSWLIEVTPATVQLDAANQAAVSVVARGAASLFAYCTPDISVRGAEPAGEGWFRVPSKAASGTPISLPLESVSSLTGPVPVLLVAVDADGIPAAAPQRFLIFPNTAAEWRVEFVRADDGRPLQLVRSATPQEAQASAWELRLLPNTRDALTGMHRPSPIKVRLRRGREGSVQSARVQAYRLPEGDSLWSSPVTVQISTESLTSDFLPLIQAAAAAAGAPPAAAAAATAAPAQLNFTGGMRFAITPEGGLDPQPTLIEIYPVMSPVTQFVQVPRPTFSQQDHLLEFRVDRVRSDGSSVFMPDQIAVEIHFSRRLLQFLRPGTPLTEPNLSDQGRLFSFAFQPEIQQATSDGGLEFGISAAGLPQVWRWKIVGDNDPILIQGQNGVPELRAELDVLNPPEEVKRLPGPELLIGEDWPKARLRAAVHFQGDDPAAGSRLEFRIRSDSGQGPRLGALPVTGRYRRDIRVAAGENSVWLFQSETSLYSTDEFDLSRAGISLSQLGLSDGPCALVAELTAQDTGQPVAEAVAALTLDATTPLMAESDVVLEAATIGPNQPLKGTVRATDAESGVREIRFGLDPAMLTPINLTSVAPAAGNFAIPASQLPTLEPKEQDQTRQIPLYFEVENRAGLVRKLKTSFALVRRGKPSEPAAKPPGPGNIQVTFGTSKTPYKVTITGPKAAEMTGTGSVIFSDLPVGKYTVQWKTEAQGLNPGSRSVTVQSGRTEVVEARPK